MRFSTIVRIAMGAAVAAAVAVPSAALAAPAVNDGNNVLPGAKLPAAQPAVGKIGGTDYADIYQISLGANDQLTLKLNGTPGGNALVFLLPKGAPLRVENAVAMSQFDGAGWYPQTLRFRTTSPGLYSIVILGSKEPRYEFTWTVAKADIDDDAPGIALLPDNAGSIDATGDWSDVYRAQLTTGQAVSATLTKPESASVGLYGFMPLTSSVYYTKTAKETLPWPNNVAFVSDTASPTSEKLFFRAPRTGGYLIQVAATKGAGDYQLTSSVQDPGHFESLSVNGAAETTRPVTPNQPLTITGVLEDAADAPIADAPVALQRYDTARKQWRAVGVSASTTSEGGFTLAYTPSRSERLRVTYAGQFGVNAPVESGVMVVPVSAQLGTPNAPAKVRAGRTFYMGGSVRPKHAAGSRPVTLKFERLERGRWVVRKQVTPKVFTKSNYSAYRFAVSMPSAGQWRVRAVHGEGDHARSVSAYDYIRVTR